MIPALAALSLLLAYAVVIYNRLVADRHRVEAAWSDVDVQLKRRGELVPKLVDSVRQYAHYEQATLDAIASLRSKPISGVDIDRRARHERELGQGVQRLMALVEAYPQLRSDQLFVDLVRSITEVEDQIQFSRRYYNGAVRALNTRIESFPDLLLARLFAYQQAVYFDLGDS